MQLDTSLTSTIISLFLHASHSRNSHPSGMSVPRKRWLKVVRIKFFIFCFIFSSWGWGRANVQEHYNLIHEQYCFPQSLTVSHQRVVAESTKQKTNEFFFFSSEETKPKTEAHSFERSQTWVFSFAKQFWQILGENSWATFETVWHGDVSQ